MKENSFSAENGTFLDRFLQAWRSSVVKKHLNKEKIVCDLGCGYEAFFLRKNKKYFLKGVGFDIKVNPLISDSRIELKEANLNDTVPLENNSVDTVTSLAVVEHIENYQKYLREVFRILKKEGSLILTTPDPRGEIVLNFFVKLNLVDKNEINDHKRYFRKEELIAILKNIGFSEVALKKFQFGFNNLFIARK